MPQQVQEERVLLPGPQRPRRLQPHPHRAGVSPGRLSPYGNTSEHRQTQCCCPHGVTHTPRRGTRSAIAAAARGGPSTPHALLLPALTFTCLGWTSFSFMAFSGCRNLPEAGGGTAGLAVGVSTLPEPWLNISPNREPSPKNTAQSQGPHPTLAVYLGTLCTCWGRGQTPASRRQMRPWRQHQQTTKDGKDIFINTKDYTTTKVKKKYVFMFTMLTPVTPT